MLKNLDPLLTPELLYVLRAMGHGDELVLADANFPAHAIAADTVYGDVIRLDGADLLQAAGAILSLLPLDSFVDAPVLRMEIIGNPTELAEVQQDFQQLLARVDPGRNWPMASLERHAFYTRARQAYVVVITGERRPYGDFILCKGVLGPNGEVV